MDLPKFLSILNESSLFFPSVATLAQSDPYEGEPAFAKIRAAATDRGGDLANLYKAAQVFKHLNFFNCWHLNDSESDAMWKIYMRGDEGIAIQTTVERLKECFRNAEDTVYMGNVKYVDKQEFDAQTSEIMQNELSVYMFKRSAFRHENEVRVGTYRDDVRREFFDDQGNLSNSATNSGLEKILLRPERTGVLVKVELATLVEKIVVSPLSPVWFKDLVFAATAKWGCRFNIEQSEMAQLPLSMLL